MANIDITLQEKQEVDEMSEAELISALATSHEKISEIEEQRKADPAFLELKQQVKDIAGEYKERVGLASAKRSYIIQILKGRGERV